MREKLKKKAFMKNICVEFNIYCYFSFSGEKKKIKILVEKYKNFVHENRNIGYILYI